MTKPPKLFTLLGEPVRWQIVQVLAEGDLMIQEIARRLDQPLNLLSYHLRSLRAAGLIAERRSSLDGRATYCSLNVSRLTELTAAAGQALLPVAILRDGSRAKALRVLFLCTHNAARSQMAEGLLRDAVQGRWLVASAGSHPSGVHPLAIDTLARRGIDIRGQSSKDPSALEHREYDIVISLCDRVRAEHITFPNRPRRIHWSLPDPLAAAPRAQGQAFRQTADRLAQRIEWFLARERALPSPTH